MKRIKEKIKKHLSSPKLHHARKKLKKALRKEKHHKTPEDVFFAFSVALAIVVLAMCLGERKYNYNPVLQKAEAETVLGNNIDKLVGGYPIEKMVPYIAKRDEKTAAYLVAIAKKESNWGKYSPQKNGKECYNYWGYRGPENPTASGYSCFNSAREAVRVVGSRLNELISQKVDTPREMVIWKCGASCSIRTSAGAAGWVRDVDYYFKKVHN